MELWGSRGFCRQYSGIHRKCDRSDLYTAWIWKMAAGGSFSFRILSKRSNRNDNGSSGKCSRRYRDPAVVAHGVATWFPSAAAGFSFLLFNLLDSPCLAAIATMAKELNDRKWFWFAILFQNVFAYVVTFYGISDQWCCDRCAYILEHLQ